MAAVLLTAPQGLVIRTQNSVAAVMAGVMAAGPRSGSLREKSQNGPCYHAYWSDVPLATTETTALVPGVTV